jgi:hypothetical protein
MSDANRVQVAIVEESQFGIKETGSKLKVLRYNSESLKQDMNTTVSEELRSDRQISDIARIGLSASGNVDFELSYGSHDELLQAALLSSGWSAEKRINNCLTISASSVDNSLNDSASGFGIYTANQWVYVSGFSNTANNGFFKIFSVTASKIIFSNGTLVTEAAGEPINVQQGGQITNGLVLPSFNIEKDFKDLSNVLSLLKGMCINTMSLEVPADGIIKGNFGFLGSAEESLTASAGSGYVAASSTVVMTGANHVTDFLENLSDLAILSFSLNLSNNLRTRLQVGKLGVASIGSGSVELSGSITLHLANAELFDKYLAQSVTSIVFAVRDEQGNGYLVELPSVKIINGVRSAGGINTDVIGDFEFRAYMDASELISIRIVRFPVMADMAGKISATSSVTGALTIT